MLQISSLGDGATADVVASGVVLPAWLPSSPAAQMGGSQLSAQFYVHLSGDVTQQVANLTALSLTPSVVSVAATLSSNLLSQSTSVLSVGFECAAEGQSLVLLSLTVIGYDTTSFAFTKICGGTT